MLVLEGEQGDGKSTALPRARRAMVFGQPTRTSASKDAAHHLSGKWLIEVAELSAIGRAEAEHLKGVHLASRRAISAQLRPQGSH